MQKKEGGRNATSAEKGGGHGGSDCRKRGGKELPIMAPAPHHPEPCLPERHLLDRSLLLPPEAMRGPLPATAKYTWQKKHGDARALPNHVLRHAFPDSGTPTAISGIRSSRHGACLGLAAGESREERAGKSCTVKD